MDLLLLGYGQHDAVAFFFAVAPEGAIMAAQREITQYSSFFLRIWQAEGGEEPASRCIEIESVQSGKKWQFEDLATTFDFLQAMALEEPAGKSSQGDG